MEIWRREEEGHALTTRKCHVFFTTGDKPKLLTANLKNQNMYKTWRSCSRDSNGKVRSTAQTPVASGSQRAPCHLSRPGWIGRQVARPNTLENGEEPKVTSTGLHVLTLTVRLTTPVQLGWGYPELGWSYPELGAARLRQETVRTERLQPDWSRLYSFCSVTGSQGKGSKHRPGSQLRLTAGTTLAPPVTP